MGELLSISCIALALSMDAFSVGLAIGMQEIRLKRIAYIGFIVGLFHVLMPFVGLSLGSILSDKIEGIAHLAAGLLLCAIGLQMILQTCLKREAPMLAPAGLGLLIFAFTVSLDSFSIGLSLGLSGVVTLLAIVLFGLFSMVFTWLALLISRRAHHLLGAYSEVAGGIILLFFGLQVWW